MTGFWYRKFNCLFIWVIDIEYQNWLFVRLTIKGVTWASQRIISLKEDQNRSTLIWQFSPFTVNDLPDTGTLHIDIWTSSHMIIFTRLVISAHDWSFLQSMMHWPKLILFSFMQSCKLSSFWVVGFSPQTQIGLGQPMQPFGQFVLQGEY